MGSTLARQPTSGAADRTVPPELAQWEASVKLTERLLPALTPSQPACYETQMRMVLAQY